MVSIHDSNPHLVDRQIGGFSLETPVILTTSSWLEKIVWKKVSDSMIGLLQKKPEI